MITRKDKEMLGLLLLPIALIIVGVKQMIDESKKTKPVIYKIEMAEKTKTEYKIEKRIIRDTAYDEVSRRCNELTSNREMPYLSVEELDNIIKELKKKKVTN